MSPPSIAIARPPSLDVDAAFWRWLLGAADAADAPSHGERVLVEALRALLANDRLAERVPRVPAIVPQLMQMLRDPARSSGEVARHLAHDPVLVASVVRTANSPYYGAARRIESLDAAVLILGHDGVRQLVAGVALKPLINVQSGRFTRGAAPRVWEQTELAGAACRAMASASGGGAFEAYLAILLRNVGAIVALRELDERCDAATQPGSTSFCAALASAANELARVIGRQWAFPAPVLASLGADGASPCAVLVRDSEDIARLRLLVDAGWIDGDDATRAIDGSAAKAACFAALAKARTES